MYDAEDRCQICEGGQVCTHAGIITTNLDFGPLGVNLRVCAEHAMGLPVGARVLASTQRRRHYRHRTTCPERVALELLPWLDHRYPVGPKTQ